jgi:hypothetical protein
MGLEISEILRIEKENCRLLGTGLMAQAANYRSHKEPRDERMIKNF